jgi:hypothetical protein
LLAAAGALALLLLWRFLPTDEDRTAERIERRAGLDLVAACNEAAGGRVQFVAGDVRRATTGPADGVATLASALEARRDGVVCRWNGVEPPTLARD